MKCIVCQDRSCLDRTNPCADYLGLCMVCARSAERLFRPGDEPWHWIEWAAKRARSAERRRGKERA